MPNTIEQAAQLQKQPGHLARLPLTPIIRGHGILGERSSNNNGVGSGGLDNRGAKNGESGDRHNRPGAAGERGRKTKWARSLKAYCAAFRRTIQRAGIAGVPAPVDWHRASRMMTGCWSSGRRTCDKFFFLCGLL
jgi:hypothetical protein